MFALIINESATPATIPETAKFQSCLATRRNILKIEAILNIISTISNCPISKPILKANKGCIMLCSCPNKLCRKFENPNP